MMKRGRKSANELAIANIAKVEAVERPDAPYELTDEQAQEWWAVVNRLPADWFPRETHAMLVEYCRHVVMARRIAELIRQAESKPVLDVLEYDRLGKMAERHSRMITSLATKMRISQQATVRAESARKPTQVTPPWE